MTVKALQTELAKVKKRLETLERQVSVSSKKIDPEAARKALAEAHGIIDKKKMKTWLAAVHRGRNAWK